jgi:putative phosphoesterase
VNVLVLADTHIPDFARSLPPALEPHLAWADRILHAGDATSADALTELSAYAPVMAVVGNCDGWDVHEWGAAEELRTVIERVPVAMLHDAGRREGRERRLRARFPDAKVIVFAHSHQPVCDVVDGVLFLNPGSPTWKRRAPAPTVARCVFEAGRVEAELASL